MSGRQLSVIVTYGVDAAGKPVGRHVVFPMFRFQPNKTHDHLALTFGEDAAPRPTRDITIARRLLGTMRCKWL